MTLRIPSPASKRPSSATAFRVLALVLALTCPLPAACAAGYDVVISGGRVMDPHTGFDEVANLGIRGDRIVRISPEALSGAAEVDARGLVVAPGFIDTHVHGQTRFGSKLMLRDGVTTTLDLEVGGINVGAWYAARKGRWQTNYGVSASHEFARMAVLDGLRFDGPLDAQHIGPTRARAERNNGVPDFAVTIPDPAQLAAILEIVDRELAQGALGLGSTVGYMAKGVTTGEMFALQRLAASYGRGTFSHVRFLGNNRPPAEGTLGFAEAFANAMALRAPFMAVHDNNQGWQENEAKLAGARAQGHNAWSEYYPYVSGSGPIGSEFLRPEALLHDWQLTYEDSMMDPATGKFFTQATYEAKRKEDPGYIVVLFVRQREAWLPEWLTRPHATVGSDGMPTTDANGNDLTWEHPYSAFVGHPRTAGSHARVLRLGREQGVDLMQTLRQLSYWAALHLGRAGIEAMQARGRIQEGMIADITVFDPETVTDNATHKRGEQGAPSTGIPYVLVSGQVVVRESKVQRVFPGQPIRYRTNARSDS